MITFDTKEEAIALDALVLAEDKARRIAAGTMVEGDAHDLRAVRYSDPLERIDGKWDIETFDFYDYGKDTIEEYDPANYPAPEGI